MNAAVRDAVIQTLWGLRFFGHVDDLHCIHRMLCRPVWYNDFVLDRLQKKLSMGNFRIGNRAPSSSPTRCTSLPDGSSRCDAEDSQSWMHVNTTAPYDYALCTQEEGDAILVPHEWGHVCNNAFAFDDSRVTKFGKHFRHYAILFFFFSDFLYFKIGDVQSPRQCWVCVHDGLYAVSLTRARTRPRRSIAPAKGTPSAS